MLTDTNGSTGSLDDVLAAAMASKDEADAANAAAVEAAYESTDDAPAEDAVEQTTTAEVPATEAATDDAGAEATTEDTVASPTAEGPSPEWLDVARRKNIPDFMLAYCHDDGEVQRMIAELGDLSAEAPAKATETDDWAAKLPFNDEVPFDATDPTHVWIKEQTEKHNKLLKAFDAVTGGLEGIKEQSEQQARAQLSQEFDKSIDALGVDFGKSLSPQRKEIFAMFDHLVKTKPNLSRAECARRAALATFPDAFQKKAVDKQLSAQAKQNSQQVGGGAAPPPPSRPMGGREKFLALLDAQIRK